MKQENSFLLKRWRDSPQDDWHFSLKDIHSGHMKFFLSAGTLVDFLEKPSAEQNADAGHEGATKP